MTPQKITDQQIIEDPKIQNFLFTKQSNQQLTKRKYLLVLKKFFRTIQITPTNLIDKITIEQRNKIVDNTIIEYDPNQGTLTYIINNWVKTSQENGIRNTTIKSQLGVIRTFLKTYNIKQPNTIQLNCKNKEWYLLTKDIIKTAIDLANIQQRAIFSFAASTGFRVGDISRFTIGDFIQATYEYHHCTELEDFLNQAPKNMMGYWEFYPHKTQRKEIKCKTFNTPESSNYILDYLKYRKSKIILSNRKNNTKVVMKKSDGLFAPSRDIRKKHYVHRAMGSIFDRMNVKIHKLEVEKLNAKLRNKEISQETYDQQIQEIPKFKAHQLRKYNHSILADHGVSLRVAAIMEGHKLPGENAKSYIKISKESIKQNYLECLEDLSFEKTEVNKITTQDKEMYNKKFKEYDELFRKIGIIDEFGIKPDEVNIEEINLENLKL